MSDHQQPTVGERARQELAAKNVDLDALAGRPMVEVAQAFARRHIPIAPAHHRPEDRLCSCGDLSCPTPGAHLVHRHLLSDPWQCRSLEADAVERSWQGRARASVGFQLRLPGERFDRRLSYDGTEIRECIEIVQIR